MRTVRLSLVSFLLWCLSLGCGGVHTLYQTPTNLTGQKNTPRGNYMLLWSKSLAPDAAVMKSVGAERSKPTFSPDGKMLYVGTRHVGLHAVDVHSGTVLWQTTLNGGAVGQPAVTEDTVIVGTGEGRLVAISRETGKIMWSNSLKGLAIRMPVVVNQAVIARDGTNTIYAFGLTSGKWLWQQAREKPAKFSMAGEGPLFAVSGNLYAGFSDGAVNCYSLTQDGRLQWSRDLGGESERFRDVDAGFAFVRQYLAVASPATGVALLDTRNGKVASRLPRPNLLSLHKLDGHLLASTTNGDVLRLDPHRNQTVWRSPFSRDGGAPNDIAVQDGIVFVTFPRSGLVTLDASTGQTLFGVDIGRGFTGVTAHAATRQVALMSTRGQLLLLGPKPSQLIPASLSPVRVLTQP